jgi:hypothetical protein
MTNSSYYPGRGPFMAADLKRTARAVRAAVEARSPDDTRTWDGARPAGDAYHRLATEKR